ncbi:MAG: hypothetical protein IPJ23_02050 [Ignavibacteriales bacterium]|nr:hypothetical protein [Ignavibacteriales bacterium]
MKFSILIIIITQLLFTGSDLLARFNMTKYGFKFSAFLSIWFLLYFIIRNVAMFGQLYIFTTIELGKTMALFGAISIILSNLLGFLILKEVLPLGVYIGVSFAVVAFLILAVSK